MILTPTVHFYRTHLDNGIIVHMIKMLDKIMYHLLSALLKIFFFHSFLIVVCLPWPMESIQQN